MTKRGPIISVIVPVYNVERHLEGCLDSILRQDLKNIEIILIDDGSTDGSGDICEAYREKDRRVTAVSQSNSGVSAARNRGIELSRGEFLCFVDSDDIIDETMLSYLLSFIGDADIASSNYRHSISPKNPSNKLSISTFSAKEALKDILLQKSIPNGPCPKLYRKSTIGDIRFDRRYRVGEDLLFNYLLLKRGAKVVHSTARPYVYVQHEGSTMHRAFSPGRFDGVVVHDIIREDIARAHPDLLIFAERRRFVGAVRTLLTMRPRKQQDTPFRQACLKTIRETSWVTLTGGGMSMTDRLYALFGCIHPALAPLPSYIKRFLASLGRSRSNARK